MIFDNFLRRTVNFFKAQVLRNGNRRPTNGLIPRYDANEIESDYSNKRKPGIVDLRDFLLLYKAHPSVYAAATDVAQLAASVKVQVEQNGKKVKEGRLTKLFKRPNPHDSWPIFMQISLLYLELTGNCFWEVLRDETGQIIAMFVLRPDRISILPHPTLKVSGYIYRPSLSADILYDPSEIIHHKYPDPDDELWGCSSLESAKNALMLDFYSSAWNKNFFKNGAEPGGTLETEQSLTDQAFKRLLETWYKRHRGVKNAHAPAVLEEGLKYKPMVPKHSDMQFDILRKMSKEEVYEAMRVPFDWRGNTAKKKSLWADNIIPKLEMIEQTINTFLINPEGTEDIDRFEIRFMVRSILSMIEEDAVKSQIANQNVTHGIWTINEAREFLYGMDEVDWGNTYMMPVGLAPWDSGLHAGGFGQATLPPDHGVDGGNKGGDHAGRSHNSQVPKLDNNSRRDNLKRHPEVAKAIVDAGEYIDIDKIEAQFPTGGDALDYWAYRKWQTFAKKAGNDERDLINTMRAFFKDQLNRYRGVIRINYKPREVKKAMDNVKDESKTEPNVDAMLLNVNKENELLALIYRAKASQLLAKYGEDVMANIGGQIDFNMNTAGIQDVMGRVTAARVTQINEYTRELMKRSLIESVQKGEDFDDAIRRLGEIFGPEGGISLLRARRIARTELITLTNTASLEAAKQSGLVAKKMWICQLLPTSRDKAGGENHVAMHKKVVDINEDFLVTSRSGVESMTGPGDTSASGENLVNCLCQLAFPPETKELEEMFNEAIERPTSKSEKRDEGVNININMNGEKVSVEKEIKKDDTPVTPYIIHNTINVPEIKIPEVKIPEIIVNVPKQDAPVIKVEIPKQDAPKIEVIVPEQKAPIVKIENKVDVPAPIINVEPELLMPDSTETVEHHRDQLGKLTSSTKKTSYTKKKKPKKD